MTATTHVAADAGGASSLRLLRDILEERYATRTNQLTELVRYGAQPGHDPRTVAALTRAARQGVADTAHALGRMSQHSYGTCERCRQDIPLGRLRAYPEARYCVPCQQILRP